MVAILEKGEYNTDFYSMVDFITASPLRYALTVKPTVFVSYIRQFWSTARIETTDEETHILATVDGIQRTVSKSSLRRNLKLRDEDGISSLPDTELFENLTLMGGSIPTGGTPVVDIHTDSDAIPTASPIVATATVVTPYSRRKGKEVMVESDTPKKQRDAEVARIQAEEELQAMIDSLDRTNETIAKYLQEYQDFASELPLERRIELISDLKTSEEVPDKEKSPEEIPEEKLKEMMQLVPIEEVYVQAL
nr:hypothetical protein [Tanacetum cinerariifolium]